MHNLCVVQERHQSLGWYSNGPFVLARPSDRNISVIKNCACMVIVMSMATALRTGHRVGVDRLWRITCSSIAEAATRSTTPAHNGAIVEQCTREIHAHFDRNGWTRQADGVLICSEYRVVVTSPAHDGTVVEDRTRVMH